MNAADQLSNFSLAAQRWGLSAAILGGLAVALGAFGAHGLQGYMQSQGLDSELIARRLANWETAARYQMYHALALFAVAWLASRGGSGWCTTLAGSFFVAGVMIFSGCLYALVLTGTTSLGRIVPIGGALLIAGWVALAIGFLKGR